MTYADAKHLRKDILQARGKDDVQRIKQKIPAGELGKKLLVEALSGLPANKVPQGLRA